MTSPSSTDASGELYGQALERSRLLEAERDRRPERLARLQSVTALLAGAMTVRKWRKFMVHEGVAALEGAAGAGCVLVDDDGMLETVEAIGYGAGAARAFYRRLLPRRRCGGRGGVHERRAALGRVARRDGGDVFTSP